MNMLLLNITSSKTQHLSDISCMHDIYIWDISFNYIVVLLVEFHLFHNNS